MPLKKRDKIKVINPTNHNKNKQHDEPIKKFLAITCNLLTAWEKGRI